MQSSLKFSFSAACAKEVVKPVSYTHLDVYKRQIKRLAIILLSASSPDDYSKLSFGN